MDQPAVPEILRLNLPCNQTLTAKPPANLHTPDLPFNRNWPNKPISNKEKTNTMSFDPTTTNPRASTGPRTDAGKAKSARNSLKTGLYSVRDYVRGGEEEEYANTLVDLMTQLSPEGILEETYATEIMKASWRLRRCRMIEQAFASQPDSILIDPMLDEKTEKQQKSVDRARAHSHSLLRRSISELTKLQTSRAIRTELGIEDTNLGLADLKQVLSALKLNSKANPAEKSEKQPAKADPVTPQGWDALAALADKQLCQQYRDHGLNSFCKPEVPSEGSFCKPATTAPAVSSKAPRNAPCPCGSGAKYKRCCGNPAAPASNPTLANAA